MPPRKKKASKAGTGGTQKKGTAAKAARSMTREDDPATAKDGSNNEVVRLVNTIVCESSRHRQPLIVAPDRANSLMMLLSSLSQW